MATGGGHGVALKPHAHAPICVFSCLCLWWPYGVLMHVCSTCGFIHHTRVHSCSLCDACSRIRAYMILYCTRSIPAHALHENWIVSSVRAQLGRGLGLGREVWAYRSGRRTRWSCGDTGAPARCLGHGVPNEWRALGILTATSGPMLSST